MAEVVAYSQRDTRWAGHRLGDGPQNIGQVGCLVSAVAGLLASWDVATDPLRLNTFLQRTYGYADGNRFVFAAVDGLGVRFAELIRCATTPAPVERLRLALAAGAGVVACVDWQPGAGVQMHWVRLLALTEHGGQIVDPWQWPGQELTDLRRYLAAGWDPARGIFAAAIYSRLQGRSATAWRARVEETQEFLTVYSENEEEM